MRTALFFTMIFIISCNSPKKIFEEEVERLSETAEFTSEWITEEKIAHLPEPVQRYLRTAGFVGQPMSGVTEVLWTESRIKLGPGQSWTSLKTEQYNFVSSGSRLAYMNARMAWIIPFEGLDRYHNGRGRMLGTLARTLKVFDNQSREVTLGGAVIVLAESLLEPSSALQEYITWEPADRFTARATFNDGDISVSGTFIFNDEGEFIRFESNDRPFEVSSGVYELKPFSIDLGEYHESEGVKTAGHVKATWHLEEGDFTYWDGRIAGIRRNTGRMSPSGKI
jgi:hypothetical protein